MSALGQKRTFTNLRLMPALPPKADIGTQSWNVRFVPKADIRLDTAGRTWMVRPQSLRSQLAPGDFAAFIAASTCAFTASRLKLAPFCIGGKSIAVSASLLT